MKTALLKIPYEIQTNPYYLKSIEIIKKLSENGFKTFIVGGFVRNQLLNLESHIISDIDIVTEANAETIYQLFNSNIISNNSFLINKVDFQGDHFEVATFRKECGSLNSRHPLHYEIGNWESDWKRRDFTINALYFNPLNSTVYDPSGGIDDIKRRRLACIGNPNERFEEDALRIYRFFRFLSNLNFIADKKTLNSINQNSFLTQNISVERLLMELKKVEITSLQNFIRHLNKIKNNIKDMKFSFLNADLHLLRLLQIEFPLTLLKLIGFFQDFTSLESHTLPFSSKDKKAYKFIRNSILEEKVNLELLKSIQHFTIDECSGLLKIIFKIGQGLNLKKLQKDSLHWICRLKTWSSHRRFRDYINHFSQQSDPLSIVDWLKKSNLPISNTSKALNLLTNQNLWEPDTKAPWREISFGNLLES